MLNSGNGPLDCQLELQMAPDTALPDPWDSLFSVPVGALTGDMEIRGCEFFLGQWWLSRGFGPHGGNNLYRLTPEGDLIGSIRQPGSSDEGWFDLATDGQNIYGSDSAMIVGMDSTGAVQLAIPSPLNPATALAYDPQSDHFWVAGFAQGIYEISRTGQVLQQFNNALDPLIITGLAWDPTDADGFELYRFSSDGQSQLTRVTRMHPQTGAIRFVIDLPAQAGEHAGGCTITHAWNGMKTLAAILQHVNSDVLRLYMVDRSVSWVQIAPTAFSVPGGGQQTVTASFDASGLRPASFRAILELTNAVLDTAVILPVTLVVEGTPAHDPPAKLPTQFALYQNFPNPFNPTTEIMFDLPVGAQVEVTIFNTLGQCVANLLHELRPAGTYGVQWNAENLASGIYLYRIKAGGFIETRKMVLLR